MSLFATVEVSASTAAALAVISVLSSAVTTVLARTLFAVGRYRNAKQRRRHRAQLHRLRLRTEQKVSAAYESVIQTVREECGRLNTKVVELEARCEAISVHSAECEARSAAQEIELIKQKAKVAEQEVAIAHLQKALKPAE